MKIKLGSCCEEGQVLAESPVNAFSAVLYRSSQSTDESRLKVGQCRRSDASWFGLLNVGKLALLWQSQTKVFLSVFQGVFADHCSLLTIFWLIDVDRDITRKL